MENTRSARSSWAYQTMHTHIARSLVRTITTPPRPPTSTQHHHVSLSAPAINSLCLLPVIQGNQISPLRGNVGYRWYCRVRPSGNSVGSSRSSALNWRYSFADSTLIIVRLLAAGTIASLAFGHHDLCCCQLSWRSSRASNIQRNASAQRDGAPSAKTADSFACPPGAPPPSNAIVASPSTGWSATVAASS